MKGLNCSDVFLEIYVSFHEQPSFNAADSVIIPNSKPFQRFHSAHTQLSFRKSCVSVHGSEVHRIQPIRQRRMLCCTTSKRASYELNSRPQL